MADMGAGRRQGQERTHRAAQPPRAGAAGEDDEPKRRGGHGETRRAARGRQQLAHARAAGRDPAGAGSPAASVPTPARAAPAEHHRPRPRAARCRRPRRRPPFGVPAPTRQRGEQQPGEDGGRKPGLGKSGGGQAQAGSEAVWRARSDVDGTRRPAKRRTRAMPGKWSSASNVRRAERHARAGWPQAPPRPGGEGREARAREADTLERRRQRGTAGRQRRVGPVLSLTQDPRGDTSARSGACCESPRQYVRPSRKRRAEGCGWKTWGS